jgi:hypothetical protein
MTPEEQFMFWEPPVVTADNVEQIKQDWFDNYQPHDWIGILGTYEKECER